MIDPNVILIVLRLKGVLGTFEEECEYINNIYGRDYSAHLTKLETDGKINFKHAQLLSSYKLVIMDYSEGSKY